VSRLLVDTSVLIDHLRGDPRAASLLVDAVRRGDELWSVTVVRTEILAGMRSGEQSATRLLLDQIHWQDVTIEIADRAGDLARRYLRSHPGVDTVDYLVAASALVLGAEVTTRNVKHFPMFPHLAPPYS
jgi:predicted nucleic acid-binding protein